MVSPWPDPRFPGELDLAPVPRNLTKPDGSACLLSLARMASEASVPREPEGGSWALTTWMIAAATGSGPNLIAREEEIFRAIRDGRSGRYGPMSPGQPTPASLATDQA